MPGTFAKEEGDELATFLKTSDHVFANVDQIGTVGTYATGGSYGVELQLIDSSVVPVDTLGTFTTQPEAMEAAASLLETYGLVVPG